MNKKINTVPKKVTPSPKAIAVLSNNNVNEKQNHIIADNKVNIETATQILTAKLSKKTFTFTFYPLWPYVLHH